MELWTQCFHSACVLWSSSGSSRVFKTWIRLRTSLKRKWSMLDTSCVSCTRRLRLLITSLSPPPPPPPHSALSAWGTEKFTSQHPPLLFLMQNHTQAPFTPPVIRTDQKHTAVWTIVHETDVGKKEQEKTPFQKITLCFSSFLLKKSEDLTLVSSVRCRSLGLIWGYFVKIPV